MDKKSTLTPKRRAALMTALKPVPPSAAADKLADRATSRRVRRGSK